MAQNTVRHSFETFQTIAEQNNLKNVSKEEYEEHYTNDEDIPVAVAIRKIGYYRDEGGNKVEAFALGAKDHITKNKSYDSCDSQIVLLQFGNEVHECFVNGRWSGLHGRKVEVRLKLSGDYRSIKKTTVTDQQWKPASHAWMPAETLFNYVKEDGKWPFLFVAGRISMIVPQTDFTKGVNAETGKYDGRYDLCAGNGKHPTCTVILKAKSGHEQAVWIEADFGPYKYADPYVTVPGWNMNNKTSVDDLKPYVHKAYVGIIGNVWKTSTFPTKPDEEGNVTEVRKISMRAFALLDLPDPGQKAVNQISAEVAAVGSGSAAEQSVGEKVDTSSIQVATKLVLEGISVAARQLKDLTVDEILKGNFCAEGLAAGGLEADSDQARQLIEMGIKRFKGGQSAPVTVDRQRALVKRLIGIHDTDGSGADLEKLFVQASKIGISEKDVDDRISEMLDEGDAFEPSLGKIRVLD